MFCAVIVDDDRWILEDIKASFPLDEFRFKSIYECTDIDEAYKKIHEYSPELVITDIRIGNSSGLDLMQRCRNDRIRTQFIILSGYGEFEYARQAIALGAFYYMLKPIDENEAYGVIKDLFKLLTQASDGFIQLNNQDKFQCLLDYIEENYAENITLSDLSARWFFNRTYICDLFQKRLGVTLTQYVNDIRIKNAAWLLTNTNKDITHIAYKVGFSDARYFSRIFKKKYGMTCLEYRKMYSK